MSASPWWIDVGTVMDPSWKPHGRVSTRRSWAAPRAAAAERLGIAGQERLAQAGLGDRAAVDAGQLAGGKAEEQPW